MKAQAKLKSWPLFIVWLVLVAIGLLLENTAIREEKVAMMLGAENVYYAAGFVFSVWFCFLFVGVEVEVD